VDRVPKMITEYSDIRKRRLLVEPVTNAPGNLPRSFRALLTLQNVARNDRTVHCSCEVVSVTEFDIADTHMWVQVSVFKKCVFLSYGYFDNLSC
jgi:hypothetical protein